MLSFFMKSAANIFLYTMMLGSFYIYIVLTVRVLFYNYVLYILFFL